MTKVWAHLYFPSLTFAQSPTSLNRNEGTGCVSQNRSQGIAMVGGLKPLLLVGARV